MSQMTRDTTLHTRDETNVTPDKKNVDMTRRSESIHGVIDLLTTDNTVKARLSLSLLSN